MSPDWRSNYTGGETVCFILGVVANYRLAGWSYEDAVERAHELSPLMGELLSDQWYEDFWAQVDADMKRGRGPVADALDRTRMWAEAHNRGESG